MSETKDIKAETKEVKAETKEVKTETARQIAAILHTQVSGTASVKKFQRNAATLPFSGEIPAGHPLEVLSKRLAVGNACVVCDKTALNHMSGMVMAGNAIAVYVLPTCDEAECRKAAGQAAFLAASSHVADNENVKFVRCAHCGIEGEDMRVDARDDAQIYCSFACREELKKKDTTDVKE